MLPPRWQRLIDDLRRRDESPTFDEELAQTLMLGRFVVLDRIGAGGMGAVFEAIDPKLDRTVALKVCKLRPDQDAAGMIEHEARCLAQLAHPNVVTVYDVVRDGPDLILVMEYVRGRTLRDWQRTTKPPWRAILERYLDAARGLAAAHAAGLEHGDFKPDNVVVGDDGRVRVIDFGVARHSFDSLDDLDLKLGGTRSYMAPERLREQPGGVTADVYAFCVSVWESLYGARPFDGDTVPALLAAIEAGQPRKGSAALDVPAQLESVLRRGLSERASERPPSIAVLVDALDRAREQVDHRPERRRQWVRRGLFAVFCVGLVIAVRREPAIVEVPAPKPDPIAQTLALAVDAMHEGLPDSAIQYLELARRRARVDDDEVALREVATQAEQLGDEFDLRGDTLHARACWYIAGDIWAYLPNPAASLERLTFKTNKNR